MTATNKTQESGTTTNFELYSKLSEDFSVLPSEAAEVVEIFIQKMESMYGREIDRFRISPEDSLLICLSFQQGVESGDIASYRP